VRVDHDPAGRRRGRAHRRHLHRPAPHPPGRPHQVGRHPPPHHPPPPRGRGHRQRGGRARLGSQRARRTAMAIRPVPEGGSRASASPAYERVPPHNVEAEESVLGSMLLSKDAIAEVLELLRGGGFHRAAPRTVFRSVLELYGHGDAVDAVTVAEELRRNGALADIGGAPFLHTLVATVPTAANAGFYARIVKEAGVLRRLIDAGTQIVQLGFETPQDTESAVDRAESLVYQVAQGRVTEDYH